MAISTFMGYHFYAVSTKFHFKFKVSTFNFKTIFVILIFFLIDPFLATGLFRYSLGRILPKVF